MDCYVYAYDEDENPQRNKKSVAIDMTDATKTRNTYSVVQKAQKASDGVVNDNVPVECDNVILECDNDENRDDDSTLVHALLRKAVNDPKQPSMHDWLVSPFSGEAVEEAYQASNAPGRALGLSIGAVFSALW